MGRIVDRLLIHKCLQSADALHVARISIAVNGNNRAGLWRNGCLEIFSGSRFIVSISMSTNTGRMLFHSNECAVATKEYGVVITSPVILNV